jgi:hypothetical protein
VTQIRRLPAQAIKTNSEGRAGAHAPLARLDRPPKVAIEARRGGGGVDAARAFLFLDNLTTAEGCWGIPP